MASPGPDGGSVHLYLRDEFMPSTLRPPKESEARLHETVSTICAFLQGAPELCLERQIATGGSYGRKTVLRGSSDGTLVVFVRDVTQFRDLRYNPGAIFRKIQEQLEKCRSTRRLAADVSIQRSSGGLTVQLSTTHQQITFEVLPAFNALGAGDKPSPQIYRDFISSLDKAGAQPGEFSVCFTQLQQKFFENRPECLRDLILLVKHWWQHKCQGQLSGPHQRTVYALELLAIYAWEQGSGQESFSVQEGIRSVLRLIEQQENLCVYWTVNYNFENETVRNVLLRQLQSPRPVILDPTDPTNNLSPDKMSWQLLKREAQSCLSSRHLNALPGPPWNVLAAPLSKTPGHLLDRFIKDFLQLNKDFIGQIHRAVDIICTFLKENCFRNSTTKVQKVVKGGSAAKGTALKNGSDADLVVFTDFIKDYHSQRSQRKDIIQEIHKQLENCQKEKDLEVKFEISKWEVPRVLSFSLKSKELNERVDFDVLPAYNALGQLRSPWPPSPERYAELIHVWKDLGDPGGEFSTCFTELQRDFVVSRPTKLKDLIRLVKYWYKLCKRKVEKMPPKYALELLTIYAWEQGSGEEAFDTAQGFRTVLELVTKYHQLCIFWTVNYDFQNETVRKFLLTQLQESRPVILDPAEPTGNVGGGERWNWPHLAQEAKEWLSFPCFMDGAGNTIHPWKVPTVQTPGSRGAQLQPIVNETVPLRRLLAETAAWRPF